LELRPRPVDPASQGLIAIFIVLLNNTYGDVAAAMLDAENHESIQSMVGWCTLTLSKVVLKAPMVSALEIL
jgi:hypothetical protein